MKRKKMKSNIYQEKKKLPNYFFWAKWNTNSKSKFILKEKKNNF